MATFKRYQLFLLIVSITVFISIRIPFIIHSSSITTKSTMSYNINTTHTVVNIRSIKQCWNHLFIHSFVESELDHYFTNSNIRKSTALITHCNINSMDLLLKDTLNTLQTLNTSITFTFHDLISLRRSMMLVSQSLNITKHITYVRILRWTSNTEASFRRNPRKQHPIFNVHLPRSAGTTICYLFRLSSSYQKNHTLKIRTDPDGSHNCNIGDGFPFYQYLVDSHAPKTCTQQYRMARGYNMFARESPLYPNHNESMSHPGLCDEFVYILSVRSPIERILSWLKWDTFFYAWSTTTTAPAKQLPLSAFITGFFSSLFETDLNPPFVKDRPILIRNKDEYTRIRGEAHWVRGYANNALVRWIGYEFTPREIQNNELMKGLLVHKEIINQDDTHFYNAIELMLRVDYVLNFASYGSDDSTANAIKYSVNNTRKYKQFERLLLSDVTRINDVNNSASVWNMLVKHLNEHYETDVFDWSSIDGSKPSKNEIFNKLSADDWKTLFKENYFDFRLYALAKHIGNIDVKYYQMYNHE